MYLHVQFDRNNISINFLPVRRIYGNISEMILTFKNIVNVRYILITALPMIKRTGQYLFQRFVGFIIFVAKTGCGRLFCALKSKRQKKK